MRILLCFVIFAGLVTGAHAQDGPKWKEFSSQEGRFKVQMPGNPRLDNQVFDNRVYGKLTLHTTTLEFGDGLSCTVFYIDYPDLIKETPVKQMLDVLRDGAVKGAKARVVFEKEIKLGKHPGRAFHFQRTQADEIEAQGWARIYLVDQRSYLVVYAGTKTATAPSAEKFLNSFKLIPQDKAEAAFQEITSKAGKYSVRMPGRPKEVAKEDGALKLVAQILFEGDAGYMVSYLDLPGAAKESAEMIHERLEAGRDSSIRDAAGKLIKSSKITLAGKHPGIEYDATVTKSAIKGMMRTRAFFVEGRIYAITTLGTEAFVNGADARRFLDSFRLTD